MAKLSRAEERFLNENEVGRLATISPSGLPHVVPVGYVYHAGLFWIAVDYDTAKYRNLLKNNRVAFVVDVYRPNRAVMVQGNAEIIERGPEFREIYAIFHKKFSWVRADPWTEGEAPFLKINPHKKASWGLR